MDNEHTPPPASADFTEFVDARRGSVRATGHLSARAADLLRGTVLALHRDGHPHVVIDLVGVDEADDAGLAALETLHAAVAEDGGRLLVLGGAARGGR